MTASRPEGSPLYRHIGAFTAQLRHSGVRHAVITPGSRSTPLTLALARDPEVRTWLHLDERAAGFFALGLARQLGEPVAVVTTSGTAAANLLPAVVEASLSRVPLIALTADRPPELRDVGANQTIDQVGLFGSHPRWSVELPIADGSRALEAHARTVAARAAATARDAPAGPVHVNVPLREPLIEPGWERSLDDAAAATAPIEVAHDPPESARVAAARLIDAVSGRRGLIVCGPESVGLPAEAIDDLARALGWPILADPLSGLRTGRHRLTRVIDASDALLRSAHPGHGGGRFASTVAPEAVVRFGAAPTSKVLNQFLAAQAGHPADRRRRRRRLARPRLRGVAHTARRPPRALRGCRPRARGPPPAHLHGRRQRPRPRRRAEPHRPRLARTLDPCERRRPRRPRRPRARVHRAV